MAADGDSRKQNLQKVIFALYDLVNQSSQRQEPHDFQSLWHHKNKAEVISYSTSI